MLLAVHSPTEIEQFNYVLKQNWNEKGFTFAEVNGNKSNLYMFEQDNELCATLELKPFQTKNRIYAYPFEKFDSMDVALRDVVEIDSLSILPEHRNNIKLLTEIFTFLVQHAIENDLKYYACLIHPKMYRVLERFYNIPVQNLGETDGDYATLMDLSETIRRVSTFKWFKSVSQGVNH
jgi:hypothetical protein